MTTKRYKMQERGSDNFDMRIITPALFVVRMSRLRGRDYRSESSRVGEGLV